MRLTNNKTYPLKHQSTSQKQQTHVEYSVRNYCNSDCAVECWITGRERERREGKRGKGSKGRGGTERNGEKGWTRKLKVWRRRCLLVEVGVTVRSWLYHTAGLLAGQGCKGSEGLRHQTPSKWWLKFLAQIQQFCPHWKNKNIATRKGGRGKEGKERRKVEKGERKGGKEREKRKGGTPKQKVWLRRCYLYTYH